MINRIYPLLLLILIIASFFHMQAIVIGIALLIIFMPLKHRLAAVKVARVFSILMLPVLFALIVGYQNDNYLILKDFYYFSIPVLFVLSGIVLACRLDIEKFLKTLVYAGLITSILVTAISVSYMGISALFDPYSAHYAMGIVGAPGPPMGLACLLFTWKFNIRLFKPHWFKLFMAINAFGIYMCASRTYFIIMVCFALLMVADKVKRIWIIPTIFFLVMLIALIPTDIFQATSSETFMSKLLGSFNELKMGDYNTEQDINMKYRGYESFMALKGYMEGDTKDWIFGGLGKTVDLKTFVRLGEDTDFQFIPVLHNGWLYLLVKMGIAGVLTYILIFFGLIIKNWRKYADAKVKPAIRLFAALSIGCIFSLLLTNYIVTALFNAEMCIVMITLGYSYLNFNALVFKQEQREKEKIQDYQFEAA
ncbi:hypothetical protein [Mucilaginibacter lappiensis]|uniref:O-Antigen ligase n=1 Tax=Mucilaginibacter lappiensis TaxID=354630 RepID=A0A1N7D1F5_9SPHI|nr:hypothetical protein [Mucilaginibacter lappiensis]MBB6111111.1 hypothetical protein [Mucilaginibacter lappiensis]MBB6128765.1 hypothetical protein [Mucilaginibacter lappiensis]SIR69544.1 hypothetical protein SAMN05421821_110130 [Mucilaginibacter lappiensis]